jgi:hypothetical protein
MPFSIIEQQNKIKKKIYNINGMLAFWDKII